MGLTDDMAAAIDRMVDDYRNPPPAAPLVIGHGLWRNMVAMHGEEEVRSVADETAERFGFNGWRITCACGFPDRHTNLPCSR